MTYVSSFFARGTLPQVLGCLLLLGVLSDMGRSSALEAKGLSPEVLQADDACLEGAEGTCDLSLLQMRGKQVDPPTPTAGIAGATNWTQDLGSAKLAGKNIMTLYHQTTPEAAASILKTGFRLGSADGICGAAIYFSPTDKDTEIKAVGGKGYMIEAKVDMGRVLTMPWTCDMFMTGERLNKLGYDSITLDRGGIYECYYTAHCKEYIIYDKSRVLSMRSYPWKSWLKPWKSYYDTPISSTAKQNQVPTGAKLLERNADLDTSVNSSDTQDTVDGIN